MMAVDISVASDVAQGSTFTVRLPAVVDAEPMPHKTAHEWDQGDGSLLCVVDDPWSSG